MHTYDLKNFARQAHELRERCVEAHNLVYRQTGVSGVAQVMSRLNLPSKRHPQQIHYTLSNLAFFGGSHFLKNRYGIIRRLENRLSRPRYTFYQKLAATPLRAFECIDPDKRTWRPVGPGERTPNDEMTFSAVLDSGAEPAKVKAGDIWVGWHVENEGTEALYFAFSLEPRAGVRLIEKAQNQAWFDPLAEIHIQEVYEEDLLQLLLDPDCDSLGIAPLFFVPRRYREDFPESMAKELPQVFGRLISSLTEIPSTRSKKSASKERVYWWELYARHDGLHPQRGEAIFEVLITQVAVSVLPWGWDPVNTAYLFRVFSREEFLWSLGLDENYRLTIDAFPPIKTHPLRLLALDEDFLKRCNLSPTASIHEAQRALKGDGLSKSKSKNTKQEQDRTDDAIALAEEVEAHRIRLRVVSIFRALGHHRQRPADFNPLIPDVFSRLDLDYRDLRTAVDRHFATILGTKRVETLDLGRQKNRILKSLSNALEIHPEELRVVDLPQELYKLLNLSGIGPGSADLIVEGLKKALLQWPPGLFHSDADEETRTHLDQGLSELEDLFR